MNKIKDVKNNMFLKGIWVATKVICTFLIVLVASLIFMQRVTNNKLNLGGLGIYTIVSGSMEPEYKVWDMIISKKIDASEIMIGDNIVYRGEKDTFAGKVVTHQVKKKRYDGKSYYFVTQGISNDLQDPEISENQVYGKVIYKSVILSLLSKLINNLYGFYFVIFIPFVILLFFEMVDMFYKEDK